MNPIDHPHGGGEGRLQVVDTLCHHKVYKLGKKTRSCKRLII